MVPQPAPAEASLPDALSIGAGRIQLFVRPAVATRLTSIGDATLAYLSLFDDEIDARFEAFLAAAGMPRSESDLVSAALSLEPTDAVILAAGGEILIARGGAASIPLYWAPTGDAVAIGTLLPVDQDRRLSRAGLIGSAAVASLANENEPNLTTQTPLDGWLRLRRGMVSRLSAEAGLVSEHPVDLAVSGHPATERSRLVAEIRAAFASFGLGLRGHPKVLVELSGGFDSTLAAIAARAQGIALLGASVHFPYYEFRFEDDIQVAVAERLAIERVRLDGESVFPFSPCDWWPRLDEPAISVVGLSHALTMARLAASEGMSRVLVGHGGDQLFSENLLGREPVRRAPARHAYSRGAWSKVSGILGHASASPSGMSRTSLTFSYDARLDVALKEACGVITRSPFTDLEVVRCGMAWARLSARIGARPGKEILAEAFATDLPGAVIGRRGKVPWDGVCARAYARHGDAIASEIDRVSGPLESIGLDVRWLVKRVARLASGDASTTERDDREVIAAYALAIWLRSWGVDRVSDCEWAD